MLETQLARLETSELVRRLRDEELTYLFKHALVQDTARASLLMQERKRLHRLVGDSLETLYPERRAELAPLLAQHFESAGDDAKTLAYATLAGDQATRVNANTEAIAHYTHALELAQRDDVLNEILQELFLKRGRVLEVQGNYHAAVENYDAMLRTAEARTSRALEMAALMARATVHSIPSVVYDAVRAQELSDRALVLARELQDAEAQAKILWNLMLLNSRVGTYRRLAAEYGEQALQIAREHNLRERLAYVLNDFSPLLAFHGQRERAIEYASEARTLWHELDNLPMLSSNYGYAVMIHLLFGNYDQAIAEAEEGLRISREIGNSWNEAFTQTWIGQAYIERGEFEKAMTVMNAAIALGESVFPPTLILTRSDLARLYTDCGQPERGIELASLALRAAEQRFPAMSPVAAGALVHAYLAREMVESARATLADTPAEFQPEANPFYAADLALAHIEFVTAEKNFTRARGLSEELLGSMRANKMRQYQLVVLLTYAQVCLSMNDLDAADELLQEARALAETMNAQWSMLRVLEMARALALARGDVNAADAQDKAANALREHFAARMPEGLRASFVGRE